MRDLHREDTENREYEVKASQKTEMHKQKDKKSNETGHMQYVQRMECEVYWFCAYSIVLLRYFAHIPHFGSHLSGWCLSLKNWNRTQNFIIRILEWNACNQVIILL